MSVLNTVLKSAEQMKEGKEYVIPAQAIHILEKFMEVEVTPFFPYRYRYIRLVATVRGTTYVACPSWDFDFYKRNRRGWPIASIYSGVPEPLRIKHDYLANKVTITNILQQTIVNKGLRFPASSKKKKLIERGLTREEIELCKFPPTTLIRVFYDIRSKEFRFNQFVEIRNEFFELAFTIRNVRYPLFVAPFPSLLKFDLKGAVLRLITGYPVGKKTARKRRSDIDIIMQQPSGIECIIMPNSLPV